MIIVASEKSRLSHDLNRPIEPVAMVKSLFLISLSSRFDIKRNEVSGTIDKYSSREENCNIVLFNIILGVHFEPGLLDLIKN